MKTTTATNKEKLGHQKLKNSNGANRLSVPTNNKTTQPANGVGRKSKFKIDQLSNFPDPFDQKTSIVFKLDHPTCVSLIVYNADTNGMTYLACGPHHEGYHKVDFDASNLPAGIYIARLRTDQGVEKIFMTKLGSKIPNKPN
jgi:hypothetical protein